MTRAVPPGSSPLSAPLQSLPGIGPVRARRLAEAGFETVGDLLGHLPLRYEDRTAILELPQALEQADAGAVETVTVRGYLEGVRRVRVRRRGLSLVRGVLRASPPDREDADPVRLPVLWFNRPYLAGSIAPKEEYLLHGRLRRRGRAADGPLELLNPSCEPLEGAIHGGRIVPVYPSLGSLGPAMLRRLISGVFEVLTDTEGGAGLPVPDPLPADLLARRGLPDLGAALRVLHLPGEADDRPDVTALQNRTSPAHRRLIYGELLEQQLALAVLRAARGRGVAGRAYDDPAARARARRVARAILPFRLTGAQRRALREIAGDLRRPEPMARLLQGDVGSGKTIVAVMALLLALEHGDQVAFMAPTELLAEQHFRRLKSLLGGAEGPYRSALVTGSNPDLAVAREGLARGTVQVAVGTHALIQEGITFRRLGLVVIDEQHRFGVVQRRTLEAKGERPEVLVMTATPIPRTLALTAYGDLDLSVIDELPPGRQPVETEVREAGEREAVVDRVARRVAAGERAYVVFPRIEAGDGAAPSLEVEGEWVRRRLDAAAGGPGVAETVVAIVHGRMAPDERERVMAAFAAGRVRVLLATTVIEVGVDVPEATMMVIEGAERFGLSQLHQLRGRIGRGEGASQCVAVVSSRDALTEEGRARLEAFAGTTDGFVIAERDLEIRGYGELLGTRQAGVARFRVADPVAHRDVLERARDDAAELAGRLGEEGMEVLRRRVERALERRRKMLGEEAEGTEGSVG